jgi:hypothetical protein
MDPRMMEMMQAMQMQAMQQQGGQGGMPPGMGGPMPQRDGMMGGQQMGPRVDQFGRPSDTGQFAFDPQQQRIAEAGLTPDRLAQMTPDQMARFQPMAPVDIDPSTGRPIDARKQSEIMAQQAFANQQQGGRGGVPMTMPPTGMPQMGGGIASIDPRVGRGGSGTFVPKTVQSGQFPTVTPQSKMGQTSRASADPRMMRGFPGF